MAESVREKLELAKEVNAIEDDKFKTELILNEALAQLSQMERDHEAMEKLRQQKLRWTYGGNPPTSTTLYGWTPTVVGSEYAYGDPADAILGKGETSG